MMEKYLKKLKKGLKYLKIWKINKINMDLNYPRKQVNKNRQTVS